MQLRALALALAVVAVACGPKPPTAAPDSAPAPEMVLLERVPADTPYVAAVLDELPADYIERRVFADADLYEQLLTRVAKVRTEPAYESFPPMMRLGIELVAELEGKMSVEGLRELGLDPRGRFVIYGLGVLPVARMPLSAPERFIAVVDGALQRARIPMVKQQHFGRDYWLLTIDERIVVVIAVVDAQLVAAVLPRESLDAMLPAVVGDARPAESLAQSKTLEQIASEYGFHRRYVGYIDFVRLVDFLAGERDELEEAIARTLNVAIEGPGCHAELTALAGAMPRVVFGSQEMTTETTTTGWVIELRDDIAAALTAMRVPLRGMPGDEALTRARLAFGAALDMGALLAFASEKLGAVAGTTYQCPPLAELAGATGELKRGVDGLAGTPVAGLRGLAMILDELEMAGGMPTKIEAAVFLGTTTPAQLLAIATAALGIQAPALEPGAPPSALTIPGLAPGMLGEAYVAAAEAALGVSIGTTASRDRMAAALAAAPGTDQPQLVLRIDPTLLPDFGVKEDYSAVAEWDAEAAKLLEELERRQQGSLASGAVELRVTPRGLEGSSIASYR